MRTEKEPLTRKEQERLLRELRRSLDPVHGIQPLKKKVHEHGQHTSKKLWIE